MITDPVDKELSFSTYQIFIIGLLTFLQFTIILDFMVLSPLGAQLMDELKLTTQQFGWVVSAYAFSAGLSALLAAGIADRFDRKKLLLFFYTGFIIGTFFCGIAPDYQFLLFSRIFTGLFGGVIGAIIFAIITDLFAWQLRGRVMGYVQMAFASSQVLGIPLGLYLAQLWGWHAPFLLIVGFSLLVGVFMFIYMKPITGHLGMQKDKSPLSHLITILTKRFYLKGFVSIALLSTGGFMLMPFASSFTVYNMGISLDYLPMIYTATGISTMLAGPLSGKFSDQVGKYKVFFWGSLLTIGAVIIYCNLGYSPLWLVLVVNVLLFVGVTIRMIGASALLTGIPDPADRGAYMSIQSAVQQLSGGIATVVAGLIVDQDKNGVLKYYDILGYIVVLAAILTIGIILKVDKSIRREKLSIPL